MSTIIRLLLTVSLCCVTLQLSLLAPAPALAQSLLPELSLRLFMNVSKAYSGSEAFGCHISEASNEPFWDGGFTCSLGAHEAGANDEVTGRVSAVALALSPTMVTGHRIRFDRRVSSAVVEHYTGAISVDANGAMWMAGEFTVESKLLCPRGVCLRPTTLSGPFPFRGSFFDLGG